MGFILCKCKYPEIHRSIMIFPVKNEHCGDTCLVQTRPLSTLAIEIHSVRTFTACLGATFLTYGDSKPCRRRNLKSLQSCELFSNLNGPTKTCGYGSIPINSIFSGMNIHKSQLFWGSPGLPGFWPIPMWFLLEAQTTPRKERWKSVGFSSVKWWKFFIYHLVI